MPTYNMPKKLQLRSVELTLGQLGVQVVSAQDVKHNAQMLCMLLRAPAEYQDAVQVNSHKLPQLLFEDVVHSSLRCCWCIGQTLGTLN